MANRSQSEINWPHVLEPLSGYLWLGAQLASDKQKKLFLPLDSAFNFGPALSSNRTVADLVKEALKSWPGEWEETSDPKALHEAKFLNLATGKVFHLLQWQPVWGFEESVASTISWYREHFYNSLDACNLTYKQISQYTTSAKSQGLPWV